MLPRILACIPKHFRRVLATTIKIIQHSHQRVIHGSQHPHQFVDSDVGKDHLPRYATRSRIRATSRRDDLRRVGTSMPWWQDLLLSQDNVFWHFYVSLNTSLHFHVSYRTDNVKLRLSRFPPYSSYPARQPAYSAYLIRYCQIHNNKRCSNPSFAHVFLEPSDRCLIRRLWTWC